MLLKAALALLACHGSSGFYLPGIAPIDRLEGEKIDIQVSSLTSSAGLPFEQYTVPFCAPEKVDSEAENLGEVLRGERIQNSPYNLTMGQELSCKILCKRKYDSKQVEQFTDLIHDDYVLNWRIDNLPASRRMTLDGKTKHYKGFPVGFVGATHGFDAGYINNHLQLTIKYHKDESRFPGARVVGFEVEPYSVKHEWSDESLGELASCGPSNPVTHNSPPMELAVITKLTREGRDAANMEEHSNKMEVHATHSQEDRDQKPVEPKKLSAMTEVIWTYSVTFEASDIRWASRWDIYLTIEKADAKIHWFSIANSLVTIAFLTGMVAVILVRVLRRDLLRFNELEEDLEDMREDIGWKYLHADVFRPPQCQLLFSILVGTGVQVFYMIFFVLIFAALGFLSPASRGALMTGFVTLFMMMGFVAGYYASRMYKMFLHQEFQLYKEPPADSLHWKKMTAGTATLVPCSIFLILFAMDMVLWYCNSSGAIPFTTMLIVGLLWFGVSVPLVFAGSHLGFKADVIDNPTKTNLMPRGVPSQPWYMHSVFSIAFGGMLPFGAVFIEIFYIMSSLWLNQFYYVVGFLAIIFCILGITCAEVTIVLAYFQLCGEDYHWWWRSYMTSGSVAVYLFGYSFVYFYTQLTIGKLAPTMMYFGYMFIVSVLFFVVTGTVGFYATFWFIRTIYAAVKID